MTSTTEIATITDAGDNTHPRWSQDGNYLLVPSKDSNIYIYERGSYDSPYKSFSTTANIGHHWDVYSNPAEDKVVVCGRYMAKIYDFDGNVLKDMSESMGVFGSVCWTPDGDHVMIANQDEQLVVDVWDVSDPDPANWNLVRESMIGLSSGDYVAFTIDVTKDGNYMAAYQPITGGDTTHVWDISDPDPANWVEEYVFSDASQPQFGMGLRRHPDSNRLLVPNCSGGDAYVYDLSDGSLVDSVNIAEGSKGGAFSPNGDYIVVGQSGTGDDIEIYDTATFTLQETLTNHTGGLRRIDFTPDGELMCSGGADSTVRVWDTSSWAKTSELGTNSIDTKVFDDTDTEEYNHALGDVIDIQLDGTNSGGSSYVDRIDMTLIDPEGVVQARNTQHEVYNEDFSGDESDWNDVDGFYAITADDTYQYGYESTYNHFALNTPLPDTKEGVWKMDMKVTNDAEHTSRLVVMYQDANNYVALYASHYYSVVGIEEVVSGTRKYEEVSKPFDLDVWHELRLEIDSGTAYAYFNDILILSKDLETSTAGQSGISTDASTVEYDNFIRGYEGGTQSSITDGYRQTYPLTLPSESAKAGTWKIQSQITDTGGGVASEEINFWVASADPILVDLLVQDPDGDNEAGSQRDLFAKVMHTSPSDISTVNIDITNPEGTEKVTDGSVSQVDSGGSYKKYKYSYTPPKEVASKGDWIHDWYADDTGGVSDTQDDTFSVIVNDPNTNNLRYIDGSGNIREIINLRESNEIELNLNNYSSVSGVDIEIQKPDGTTAETGTMTDEGSGKYTYSYMPSYGENADLGDYKVIFSVNHPDYSKTITKYVKFVWKENTYPWRKKLEIDDKFNSTIDISGEGEVREETVTLEFDVPSEHINASHDMLYITDERGLVIPYELISASESGGTTTLKVKIDLSVLWIYETEDSTDDFYPIDLYAYYSDQKANTHGTTITDKHQSIGYQNINEFDASQFFTSTTNNQVTEMNAVMHGDPDGDGTEERVMVGKTMDDSKNSHGCIMVLTPDGTIESTQKMQINDESAWISGQLADVDGDGEEELIVAGWTYISGDGCNSAVVAIYSYDGSSWTQDYQDVYNYNSTSPVATDYFALDVGDFDDDGNKEIAVCGRNNDVNPATVRIYDTTLSFIDDAGSGFNTDRDRLFTLGHGDLDGDGTIEIVSGGTTDSGNTNPDGHFILDSTISIFNFDGSTLTREAELQWNITDYTTEDEDMTETFSNVVGDVDNDGNIELLTSGNWYDYDNEHDVAQVRVWTYDGTNISQETFKDIVADGHASILSIDLVDLIGDGENEIVGVGFKNDGTLDRGCAVVMTYDGSFTLQDEDYINLSEPVRDGESNDCFTVTQGDGVYIITSSGVKGQTPPMTSYWKVRHVGGIAITEGSEEYFHDFVQGYAIVTRNGIVQTKSGGKAYTERP